MLSVVDMTTVSIHAPGRGATLQIDKTKRPSRSFNSRTREGCDARRVSLRSFSIAFQFTHPGGVRLDPDDVYETLGVFQFTHPGGVRR